jgi:hypothetical protein
MGDGEDRMRSALLYGSPPPVLRSGTKIRCTSPLLCIPLQIIVLTPIYSLFWAPKMRICRSRPLVCFRYEAVGSRLITLVLQCYRAF